MGPEKKGFIRRVSYNQGDRKRLKWALQCCIGSFDLIEAAHHQKTKKIRLHS